MKEEDFEQERLKTAAETVVDPSVSGLGISMPENSVLPEVDTQTEDALDKHCGTCCFYFIQSFRGVEGKCHRFPPTYGDFPKVKKTDHCGEFVHLLCIREEDKLVEPVFPFIKDSALKGCYWEQVNTHSWDLKKVEDGKKLIMIDKEKELQSHPFCVTGSECGEAFFCRTLDSAKDAAEKLVVEKELIQIPKAKEYFWSKDGDGVWNYLETENRIVGTVLARIREMDSEFFPGLTQTAEAMGLGEFGYLYQAKKTLEEAQAVVEDYFKEKK